MTRKAVRALLIGLGIGVALAVLATSGLVAMAIWVDSLDSQSRYTGDPDLCECCR